MIKFLATSYLLLSSLLIIGQTFSPVDFEKKILSYETISASTQQEVYDKAKEGLYIKWSTILYVIQRIDGTKNKIAFIDSLQKIVYWDNEMKINLFNEKLYFLVNNDNDTPKREVDSLYISLSIANKKLISDDYHSNLIQYAKWNLEIGDSYYRTFLDFEKADKFFLEVLAINVFAIKDANASRTLDVLYQSALLGRLECARGSVHKLKNIVIPPAFYDRVLPIYKAYMIELGEKPEINNFIDREKIIIKKD